MSGFHDTQEELEKVSSVKGDLDEQKGKSLDEISDMVRSMTIYAISPDSFHGTFDVHISTTRI